MVDRPPPSRFSVVERGGRLVVIDRETGRTPPTAAERMDAYNRMGVEPNRPAARAAPVVVETASIAKAPPPPREAPHPRNDRMAAAVAAMNKKQPWTDGAKARAPQPTPSSPAPARIAERPQPPVGAAGRKTIVTGKWWDAKGPRTIDLGPKGQQVLTSGFLTLFFVALIAAIVALFIEPLLLFVAAFLLFRFGGNILGPIGASLIDKALAERG